MSWTDKNGELKLSFIDTWNIVVLYYLSNLKHTLVQKYGYWREFDYHNKVQYILRLF